MTRSARLATFASRLAPSCLAALLLCAAGCGDDGAPLVCDVREPSCHRTVFRVVGEILGRPTLDVVPVELVTPEEWTAERARWSWPAGNVHDAIWADALFQVGFLRERVDSPSMAGLAALGENVAASYGGDPRRITMVAPDAAAFVDPEAATAVLAHEAVHAYQDHAFRTHTLMAALGERGDAPQAALLRAALEGQAMAVEGLLAARRFGVSPGELDWTGWARRVIGDVPRMVDEATSPYVEVRWLIHYAAGAALVAEALRAADFDVRVTDDLIRRPPPDMAGLLVLVRDFPYGEVALRDAPLELPLGPRTVLPSLPSDLVATEGLAHYGTQSLDAWDVALLFAPDEGASAALDRATDCAGGTLEVFLPEDTEPISVLTTWWRSPWAADDAATALARAHTYESWMWKANDRRSAADAVAVRRRVRAVSLVVSASGLLSERLAEAALLGPEGAAGEPLADIEAYPVGGRP